MRNRTICVLISALFFVTSGVLVESQEELNERDRVQDDELDRREQEGDRLYDFKTGNLEIAPTVTQSMTYNDNIFLEEEEGDEWDWISRTTGGLDLDYDTDRLDLSVGQRSTYKDFLRRGAEDDAEHLSTGAAAVSSGPFTFGVSGYWSETSDPVDLVFTPRIELIQANVSPYVTFESNPWSITGRYNYNRFDYKDSTFSVQDYQRSTGELDVSYALNETWDLIGRARAGHAYYHDDFKNNYDIREALGGVSAEPSDSATYAVVAGYHSRDHEDSGSLDNETDYSSWVARATANWQLTDRDLITAGFYRRIRESVFSNYTVRNRLKARYARQITDRFEGVLSARFDRIREATDDVDRDEKEGYRFLAGTRYEIKKWLPVSLDYIFERKETNEGGGEYNVNKVVLTGQVRF